MARSDTHLDGMLRHLGAAYYDSLQGRATQADVSRAVDTVAEHLNERARVPAGTAAELAGQVVHQSHPALTAGALMTAPAITVGPRVTVHAAGHLMSARHVRLLPVVDEHARLIGVVSRRDKSRASISDAISAICRSGWSPRFAMRSPIQKAESTMTTIVHPKTMYAVRR